MKYRVWIDTPDGEREFTTEADPETLVDAVIQWCSENGIAYDDCGGWDEEVEEC